MKYMTPSILFLTVIFLNSNSVINAIDLLTFLTHKNKEFIKQQITTLAAAQHPRLGEKSHAYLLQREQLEDVFQYLLTDAATEAEKQVNSVLLKEKQTERLSKRRALWIGLFGASSIFVIEFLLLWHSFYYNGRKS